MKEAMSYNDLIIYIHLKYLFIDPLHMLWIIGIKRFATMNLSRKQTNNHKHSYQEYGKTINVDYQTSSHFIRWAYSIQCAAVLGVSARVHNGNLTWGGKSQMVHSKQGVTPGRITLAWPLKPSVPPSTIGLIVSSFGLSFSSYSVSANEACIIIQLKNHIGKIFQRSKTK